MQIGYGAPAAGARATYPLCDCCRGRAGRLRYFFAVGMLDKLRSSGRATAAARRYAQLVGHVTQGARAIAHASLYFSIGDGVANTDIHEAKTRETQLTALTCAAALERGARSQDSINHAAGSSTRP